MSPELSVGDVGKASGGNVVLAPSPSVRILLRSPVFFRFGVGVGLCGRRAAADAQVLAGDAVASLK